MVLSLGYDGTLNPLGYYLSFLSKWGCMSKNQSQCVLQVVTYLPHLLLAGDYDDDDDDDGGWWWLWWLWCLWWLDDYDDYYEYDDYDGGEDWHDGDGGDGHGQCHDHNSNSGAFSLVLVEKSFLAIFSANQKVRLLSFLSWTVLCEGHNLFLKYIVGNQASKFQLSRLRLCIDFWLIMASLDRIPHGRQTQQVPARSRCWNYQSI